MTSRCTSPQTTFEFSTTGASPPRDEGTTRILGPRKPRAWRVWASGCHFTREFELRVGQDLTIGSGSDVEMRVTDATVSRRHCRVEATAEGLRVTDLDSTNGVSVAGVRVAAATLSNSGPGFVVGRTAIYVRALGVESADDGLPGMVGTSEGVKLLAHEVRCFAPHDAAVLLQGETGSGKDVVARAIHELSGRQGPFVAVNVGALQDSLADAELFGHKRGAFTGAVQDRKGAFEQAHGGTLFLDEIADMSPAVQVKLLRAIEEKRIRPVGAEREVSVDVRVVAASWAKLEELAEEGRFRWDLYHRLCTAVVRIPALRQRRADIPLLARHFLRVDAVSTKPVEMTDDALELLKRQPWRGNVRELRAVLKRAAMLCPNGLITAAELEVSVSTDVPMKKVARQTLNGSQAVNLLQEHGGNVSAAARAAGLPRSTFRHLIALHRPPLDNLRKAG